MPFCLQHPEAKIVIEEDGEATKYDLCGMYTMDLARHKKSKTCKLNQAQMKNKRLQDQQVYGQEFERVSQFQYLGRIMREDDDDSNTIMSQI